MCEAVSCGLQLFEGWQSSHSEMEPVNSCVVRTDSRSVCAKSFPLAAGLNPEEKTDVNSSLVSDKRNFIFLHISDVH